MVLNSTPAQELPKEFLNSSISLVERSALKLCPVVAEVCRKMAGAENEVIELPPLGDSSQQFGGEEDEEQVPDMRSVLGFLN